MDYDAYVWKNGHIEASKIDRDMVQMIGKQVMRVVRFVESRG
jgi:hypothetical protein